MPIRHLRRFKILLAELARANLSAFVPRVKGQILFVLETAPARIANVQCVVEILRVATPPYRVRIPRAGSVHVRRQIGGTIERLLAPLAPVTFRIPPRVPGVHPFRTAARRPPFSLNLPVALSPFAKHFVPTREPLHPRLSDHTG